MLKGIIGIRSSTKVLLCVIWILSFDFVYSAWMHWYHDDFTPNHKLEDEYIYEYGNDEDMKLIGEDEEMNDYQKWDAVRNLYEGRVIGKLIKLCMIAHKQAGRGNVSINVIKLNARKLSFENPFYESRFVDVLTYGVKNETDITTDYWDLVVGPQNYITEGIRPDCVCYLILLSSLKMEFSLHDHVCGINVTGITDVASTRRWKPTTPTTIKRTRGTKKSTKNNNKTTKKFKVTKKSTNKKKVTRKTITRIKNTST